MTKEKAREFAALLLAYAEGKTIEWRWASAPDAQWQANKNSDFAGFESGSLNYRIKPELKLRPWTAEEVPVGRVVRFKGEDTIRRLILAADHACVSLGTTNGVLFTTSSTRLLDEFILDDGSPCGVQEQPC